MAITADVLDRVLAHVQETVVYGDLARTDWRRQTDAVKDVFVAARMFTDLGPRAITVDGRMSRAMILRALRAMEGGTSPTAFFNARCHDAGLTGRRLIVYDTKTNNDVVDGRGNSRARLHFHGIFELPERRTFDQLRVMLRKVFGNAVEIERFQLRLKPIVSGVGQDVPHYTLQSATAYGPMGKVFYALDHAGSTYATLGLNEAGKRSRSAPWQGAANRAGKRLAKGVPSNFNREVVFCDRESVQLGREAFEAWIDREKELHARRRGNVPKTRRSAFKATPERKAG
jgi:hypothetical protein